MKKIFVCSLLASVILFCKAQKPKPSPISVIFDTDIGNDIDDVLALQMLFNYEQQKKAKLLGITISKSNPRVIDYIDGYCRLNNRPDMPLGYAYNGATRQDGKYVPATLDTTIEGKKIIHPKRSIADHLPEGYLLLRRLLAQEPDHSVVLIVVGPQTNIGRLLNSGPDGFSTLNGIELVKKKVKLVSVMGGMYTAEFDFPEWNIVQDIPAAKILFDKCPVPIVASGFEIGYKFKYPAASILNDFENGYKHPLVVSYKVYEKMPYNRETWDLTSVLYALEPEKNYFALSAPGKIDVDEKGNTTLKAGKGQQQVLLYKKNEQDVVKAMIRQVTGK